MGETLASKGRGNQAHEKGASKKGKGLMDMGNSVGIAGGGEYKWTKW